MEATVADSTIDWALKLAEANSLDDLKVILETLLNDKKVQKYTRENDKAKSALFKVLDRVYGSNATVQPTKAQAEPREQKKEPPTAPTQRQERKPRNKRRGTCQNSACINARRLIFSTVKVYGEKQFSSHVRHRILDDIKKDGPWEHATSCNETCEYVFSLLYTTKEVCECDDKEKYPVSEYEQLARKALGDKSVDKALGIKPTMAKEETKQAPPAPAQPQPEPAPKEAAPEPKPEPAEKPAPSPEPEAQEEQAACPISTLINDLKSMEEDKRVPYLENLIDKGILDVRQLRRKYGKLMKNGLVPDGFDYDTLITRAYDVQKQQAAQPMTLTETAQNN